MPLEKNVTFRYDFSSKTQVVKSGQLLKGSCRKEALILFLFTQPRSKMTLKGGESKTRPHETLTNFKVLYRNKLYFLTTSVYFRNKIFELIQNTLFTNVEKKL